MIRRKSIVLFSAAIAAAASLHCPAKILAALSESYTASASQTVDTRNGVFADWVIPSPTALIAERQASGNLLSVQLDTGTLAGQSIGAPNATFTYNRGTPVATGTTSADCAVFATGANGSGYSAFTVQAQVPAGSSGTLTVYDPQIEGTTAYIAGLYGPSDPNTSLNNSIYSFGDGYFVANYSAVGNATLYLTVQNYAAVNNGYVAFGGATLTSSVPEPASAVPVILVAGMCLGKRTRNPTFRNLRAQQEV